jgi:ABC-type transporter MlaC component
MRHPSMHAAEHESEIWPAFHPASPPLAAGNNSSAAWRRLRKIGVATSCIAAAFAAHSLMMHPGLKTAVQAAAAGLGLVSVDGWIAAVLEPVRCIVLQKPHIIGRVLGHTQAASALQAEAQSFPTYQAAFTGASSPDGAKPGTLVPMGYNYTFWLTLLILLPIWAASGRAQTSDPALFVLAFNHDVSEQLGPTIVDAAERKRRFAVLMDEGLDLDVIGEILLGWRWARITPADRQAFSREFRAYLIQNFAMKVTGFDDSQLIVTSVRQDGSTVLVVTEVNAKKSTHQSYAWRVVPTATGWRLCDVIVSSVSMAALMRSQFDSVLQDGASDIGPLLRLLHEKSPG